MEDKELSFSPESFSDISTREEAGQAVDYFSKNEIAFRRELEEQGKSYNEIQETVKKTWVNLLRVCKRTGYSDDIVTVTARQYGFKM